MILFDLHKIPNIRVVAVIVITFSAVFPPLNLIYQMDPTGFKNKDLLTLIVLAFSSGFPVALFNTLLMQAYAVLLGRVNGFVGKELWAVSAIAGSVTACFAFYLPCLYIFFPKKFLYDPFYDLPPLLRASWGVFGFEITITIGLGICIAHLFFLFQKVRKNRAPLKNRALPTHQNPDLPTAPLPLQTSAVEEPVPGSQPNP